MRSPRVALTLWLGRVLASRKRNQRPWGFPVRQKMPSVIGGIEERGGHDRVLWTTPQPSNPASISLARSTRRRASPRAAAATAVLPARAAAGITYRQLDYWARTGLVVPSVRSAAGSGQPAAVLVPATSWCSRWSSGCSTRASPCSNIRAARRARCALAAWTTWPASRLILRRHHRVRVHVSRRRSSTCCAGGQGVFGIAVSGALRELAGSSADFPAEVVRAGARRRSTSCLDAG